MDANSMFSCHRKVSNFNLISRIEDAVEKRRFRHLMQHGQGFFVIQYHMLTTSFLSVAGPKVPALSRFVFKKFHHAIIAKFK